MESEAKLIHDAMERVGKKRGVHAVGFGPKRQGDSFTGEDSIVVCVTAKKERKRIALQDRVPREIHGVKTDVIELPEMDALPAVDIDYDGGFPDQPHGHRLPMMGGDEIGPVNLRQGGTAGALLRLPYVPPGGWKSPGNDYFLSNWHVFQDHGQLPMTNVGTMVQQAAFQQPDQPAPRIIGAVSRDTPIDPSKLYNQVDAALVMVRPSLLAESSSLPGCSYPGDVWDHHFDAPDIWDYHHCPTGWPHFHEEYNGRMRDIAQPWGYLPTPAGMGAVTRMENVRKSGRTTGTTYGYVYLTNMISSVGYGDVIGRVNFSGQILIYSGGGGPGMEFCKAGDSGSVVIDQYNMIVALLFAGASSFALVTPIQTVLQRLLTANELQRVTLLTEDIPRM